jgi:hypothetical protein
LVLIFDVSPPHNFNFSKNPDWGRYVALSLPLSVMLVNKDVLMSLPKLNSNHPVHKETLYRVGKLFLALISELNCTVSFESVVNLSVTAEWLGKKVYYLPSYECAHPYPLSCHNYRSVTVSVHAAAFPIFPYSFLRVADELL